MSIWVIRILLLLLCTTAGYAVSELPPQLVSNSGYALLLGFCLVGLLSPLDEMPQGFSLRAFSTATLCLTIRPQCA